jgi:uncharacterized protein (TIGR03084 family)
MMDESSALAAQVKDLREEGRELDSLLARLSEADWGRATAFKAWTIWDVVAHLHVTDHMGVTSLAGDAAFRALMKDIGRAGVPLTAYTRRWVGDVSGETLRSRWRALLDGLCTSLEAAAPDVRLTWAGPGMKPRMFATARQMEIWAHGSEIYDLLGVERVETDRIRNIATIGVRTFGWTFANRKLEPPAPIPFVRLTAPSGAVWTWNEEQGNSLIEGRAVEFCQVVTQTRNIADTELRVVGEPAQRWMAIAQCFAGPPEDPPAPGTRMPCNTK